MKYPDYHMAYFHGDWLSFYLFMIFGLLGACMLGDQEYIYDVIYPFGYVAYAREWSKIP